MLGVAAIRLDIAVQPFDGELRVFYLRGILKALTSQPVARDRDDNSVQGIRPRDKAVLSAVALAKAAAVQEQEHRSADRSLLREVQIQPLFDVRAILKIKLMRQFGTHGGGAGISLAVEARPIGLELLRMLHRIVLG